MAATDCREKTRRHYAWFSLLGFLLVGLAACDEPQTEQPEETVTPTEYLTPTPPPGIDLGSQARLLPLDFDDLPGWSEDRQTEALPALIRSCERLNTLPLERVMEPEALAMTAGDWREACGDLPAPDAGVDTVRAYFESHFRPFAVVDEGGQSDGLFTGYYEAEVRASLVPLAGYDVPLYQPPQDRVTVDLSTFGADLPKQTLVGRVAQGRLVPYYSRAEINAGQLSGQGLELIWLDDPVDAFFLSVQGSGVATLPDGSELRLGYAASNGREFYAIGRALIESGELPRDSLSMQGIRDWLRANPDRASELMARNDRYIFFRIVNGEGPIGTQGVALTPRRSLAVDRSVIPLGAPLWLVVATPDESEPRGRLMVAQDTGSAIKGAVRGDFFFGSGEPALAEAGRMKATGKYWLLLPQAVAQRLSRPDS